MQLDQRFIKIAHDPGDPQLCSHCPFCGSGQITGRSDGGIDCAFCGMSFLVRVQPAFPGMPQAPGMGAPTDIGPDMPPELPGMGPAGELPPGAEDEGLPPGADDGEGAPPFGDDGGDEEDEEAPEDGGEDEDGEDDDDASPFAKKKGSRRLYRTLAGDQLSEQQYVRHLAVLHSGASPAVLAQLRREARHGYTEEDDEGFAWPTYYDHETGEHEIDGSSAPRCGTCSRHTLGDVHHWPEDGHEPDVQRHIDREKAFYDRMDRGEYDSSKYCGPACEEGHYEDLKRGIGVHHTFAEGEPEHDEPRPAPGEPPRVNSPFSEPAGRSSGRYEVRDPSAERRCHYCRAKLPSQHEYRAGPGSSFRPFDPAEHGGRTHQTLSRRLAAQERHRLSMSVEGPADQLKSFAQLCKTIGSLCSAGASRTIHYDVDGDGSASLRFDLGPFSEVSGAGFDSDPVRVPGLGG